jgi:inhibitor of KinA sporulation pathway (predicted exonuclease)
MEEPVLAADGNHYDRSFIAEWMQDHNTSPMTNLELEHKHLVLDRVLLNEIREWKELHGEA